MKIIRIIATGVFTAALAQASYAQSTAVSGSSSTATASNAASSGAISGAYNQNVFTSPSNTTAEIKNVPSVTAPSLGGGGHPCLQAVSGGVSLLGGGASLGKSDAEVVCMLSFLGQNEAAIRALVSKNDVACKAIHNVGYYVVPMGNGRTKAVSFKCDKKTVRGGVYSSRAEPIATRTVSTKSAPQALYQTCRMTAKGIHIKHKYHDAARKAQAVAQCKTKLGY